MSVSFSPLMDLQTGQPVVTRGVLALGNFDGVHLGHIEVVRLAVQKARELGVPAYALTFDPHPYTFFKKDGVPFLLTPPTIKHDLLKQQGVDAVVTLAFSPDFAALTPEEFMEKVLIKGCAVRHVVVGFDFVFGAGRGGDRDALRQRLLPLGIGVTEVPPYRDEGGEIISSTRIRAALRAGEPEKAAAMLGRPFALWGRIQEGEKRGHDLGYPTANIVLGDAVRPKYGVYAIRARRHDERVTFGGVANIGVRPTVGGGKELLEFHLFNLHGSLYGQEWEVSLLHYLRGEQKFASLDALKEQIEQDVKAARSLV